MRGAGDYIWDSSGFTTVYAGNPIISAGGLVSFPLSTTFQL